MARGRRIGRRLAARQLALALLMATSASAISLSDFQLISSSSVPLACILAYDATIPGCSTRDFTQGNACSSRCVRGLETIQSAVETVCQEADVASNSVLGQAVQGNLVDILCPTGKDTTTAAAASSTPQTPTTAGAATTTRTIPTFTAGTSTTSSSSSSSSAAQTTVPEQLSTSSVEPTSTTSAETSLSETTAAAAGTTLTQVTSSTTSHKTSSTHKPEATRGGDPFQNAIPDGSAALGVQRTQKMLLAFICGAFLLR